MDKKEKHSDSSLINAAISGVAADTVKRFGSAVKEHSVAYSGVDHENHIKLAKSLSSIEKSKVHPDYRDINLKQQSGFSAEVETATRENVEKIIAGDTRTRVSRTDDMKVQSDGRGHQIGGTNDQLVDLAEVTPDGKYIEGTGRQLKYVGNSPEECKNKLLSRQMDKYRDTNTPLEIASDHYDKVQSGLSDQADKLKKQIENAEAKGNRVLAKKHREQLQKVEKTKKLLRKGKLTNQEALNARTNPRWVTIKEQGKLANRAGLEAAMYGAAVGGTISIATNLVAWAKDDKELDDAVKDVAKETATSAAVGYGTGAAGSLLKGFMQNAGNSTVRSLSKTNIPAAMVSLTVEVGKTMKSYIKGDITGIECFERLGEQGTGMVSSALGATVGHMMIPSTIISGLAGGMIGYAVSSVCYKILLDSFKDAKLAREERIEIERVCAEHSVMMRKYRREIEEIIEQYLNEKKRMFNDAFEGMDKALITGNADQFIASANIVTESLGQKSQFKDMNSFNKMMMEDDSFEL